MRKGKWAWETGPLRSEKIEKENKVSHVRTHFKVSRYVEHVLRKALRVFDASNPGILSGEKTEERAHIAGDTEIVEAS